MEGGRREEGKEGSREGGRDKIAYCSGFGHTFQRRFPGLSTAEKDQTLRFSRTQIMHFPGLSRCNTCVLTGLTTL